MKVRICTGSKCIFYGASHILENLEELKDSMHEMEGVPEDFDFEIELIPCPGGCKGDDKVAPLVYIDGEAMYAATGPKVMAALLDKASQEKEV